MKYNLPVDYNKLSIKEKKRVREQYIEEQGGMCMYCNEELSFPPPKKITDKQIFWRQFPDNFLKYPIHLQHDHGSGLTEGAVHAYCNAVLWQYDGR
jgi:hypothetical protein